MFRCLAVAPVCLMACSPALAQEGEARQETVIVTGQYLYSDQVNALRTPTPIIDVPQSLSIIAADQIAAQPRDDPELHLRTRAGPAQELLIGS